MFNYNLIIEYEGTNFVGWQKQKKGQSIQHEVEKALRKIFKAKINLVGSGRTDAGVHALGQSAHFIVKNKIENYYKVKNSLNYFLNKKKIVITDIKLKSESFHARFDAVERVYEYKIINRDAPLCLDKNRAWHIKKNLDLVKIKKGLKILKGIKDFSTFRASSCQAKSPLRKLLKAEVKKHNNLVTITFSSKAFLQQQVRSMVGCLKYLADGRWQIKQFQKVAKSQKRSLCAPPAPATGLYLKKVIY